MRTGILENHRITVGMLLGRRSEQGVPRDGMMSKQASRRTQFISSLHAVVESLAPNDMPFFPPGTGTGTTFNVENGRHADTIMSSEEALSPSRIRVKNRRKRYLDLHPEYFTSANLELAGPPHAHGIPSLIHSTNTLPRSTPL